MLLDHPACGAGWLFPGRMLSVSRADTYLAMPARKNIPFSFFYFQIVRPRRTVRSEISMAAWYYPAFAWGRQVS
jgi:hypothetical protein